MHGCLERRVRKLEMNAQARTEVRNFGLDRRGNKADNLPLAGGKRNGANHAGRPGGRKTVAPDWRRIGAEPGDCKS